MHLEGVLGRSITDGSRFTLSPGWIGGQLYILQDVLPFYYL